jgi:transcription-repair coupling factor (superfamily II helicase)
MEKLRTASDLNWTCKPELTQTFDAPFGSEWVWKNLAGSALAIALQAWQKKESKQLLVISENKEEALVVFNDLQTLLPNSEVFFLTEAGYPEQNKNKLLIRSEALNAIRLKKANILVAYTQSIAEETPALSKVEENHHVIKKNDRLDQDFLFDLLLDLGFEREDFVFEPGTFALRGGIIDVYSYAHEKPFRIVFDGDLIAEIKEFDPVSQLSTSEKMSFELMSPLVTENINKKDWGSVLDWFSEQALLAVYDFKECITALSRLAKDRKNREVPFIDEVAFEKKLREWKKISFSCSNTHHNTIDWGILPPPVIAKQYEVLANEMNTWKAGGGQTLILFPDTAQHDRLDAIFSDSKFPDGIRHHYSPSFQMLHSGFRDVNGGLLVLTAHEIFDRYRRIAQREGFSSNQALTIKSITQLNPGDFVTHIDHGICRFAGLEKSEQEGKVREVVKLIFSGGDAVYVSIHALHRISRYAAGDASPPTLSKLGSGAWQAAKNKTRKRLKELAFDLLSLYAKRRDAIGFAFSADNYLMHALEASFPFEETEGQALAIKAVKADMEKPYPMDRLICGDVGFGKTEVALRAAFKAVCDSKQVAILVPTTILALQHHKTFLRRLRDLPCTIAYLNRFRSAAEQREIKQNIQNGTLDIVIATHKLLASDIEFKNLGLLIIDEEQKFGVNAKEKLKNKRVNVDTLTLTATPIPRTLQFSLMGARDLSIIRTPPVNRYPVQTVLSGFNEGLIREAIQFELARNGQVFFMHNRIQGLPELATQIKYWVPKARVAFAHGQMEGKKLEEVMMQFIEGEIDVLISTSIIENGLDVPNANTIIINQAHQIGLSDLHQMRGRVGRSNRKAFCYLITPPLEGLPSESVRRLKALVEFSDLGSGFDIAMKDLDIRGAGDLLGAEQSGFINELGFETYQKVLAEAVRELKQNEFKALFVQEAEEETHTWVEDCQIDTDLPLMIPDNYVDSIAERLALYRKLDGLEEEHEVALWIKELEDRFGKIPNEVQSLTQIIQLRKKGKQLGWEKILLKKGSMVAYFPSDPNSAYYQSSIFTSLLQRITTFTFMKLQEKNNKLTLHIQGVTNTAKAVDILNSLS